MNPRASHQRSNTATLAFVGPHRALVTAKSAPAFAFDVGAVVAMPADPWAGMALVPPAEAPVVTHLSARDSSIFADALQVETPNDALRQAVARRVVLRG